ncbi:glucose-6-phosphate dehydrogenase [uncultured Granulicatella sp.]|jgi:glucose-6-phosphate dehydrogenase|uniref:glucose-6-phosphate dehydrogenase n=1 Tax=uncultured Granulicatella sp. TaxID=316089 RepID=UPI0028E2AFEE|nr:glucose-6-phosphate dehydrogenase [uncultured Granulicatella sp.]
MQEQKVLITFFGATGDLASRKLYPALFRLFQKGFIRNHFAVIGTARREWTDEHFREVVVKSVQSLTEDVNQAEEFASHFYYQAHNVTDTHHYVVLKELSEKLDQQYGIEGNRIFYLAMAPSFFGTITQHLKDEALLTDHGYNRLIIEKPFGKDYESAQILNEQLRHSFDENQIYRIDHYLGKEMIQNITAVRFANRVFETMWNREHIDNVQITLAEQVGVEERGGYYETSGALRDMVQNHILQILALVAMEPPQSFEAVRQNKINVLEQLRHYSPEEVAKNFVRGQYGPSLDGSLPGYRQDQNVSDDSNMETYVAGKVFIDNERWKDVPFYVRTGKSLNSKTTVIDVVFKEADSPLFEHETKGKCPSNRISIHITPKEGFCFVINSKAVGNSYGLQTSHLEKIFDKNFGLSSPEAYERLILDCMEGDMTNFTHWEEVAASWKFVDRIRQAWDAESSVQFPNYPAGSSGPQESFDLLAQDGRCWVQK